MGYLATKCNLVCWFSYRILSRLSNLHLIKTIDWQSNFDHDHLNCNKICLALRHFFPFDFQALNKFYFHHWHMTKFNYDTLTHEMNLLLVVVPDNYLYLYLYIFCNEPFWLALKIKVSSFAIFLYILLQTKLPLLLYTLVLTRHRKWSQMQLLPLLVSLQVILQEWDFTISSDLCMSRFMITFASSFMIQVKPQIENIPKICGQIHISPCPMPFILKFTLHFHLKTNDTNSKQNNLNSIFKTKNAHL